MNQLFLQIKKNYIYNFFFIKFYKLPFSKENMQVLQKKQNLIVTQVKGFEKRDTQQISEICLTRLIHTKSSSTFKNNEIVPWPEHTSIASEPKEKSQCSQIFTFIKKINMNIGFRIILFILLLVFLVSCCIQDPSSHDYLSESGETIQKYCFLVFGIFSTIELINWKNHHKIWFLLDFISLSTGISAFFVQDYEALKYLKAIRCLKLLYFIKINDELCQTMKIFLHSWKKVVKLFFPCLMLIFLISVANLFSFIELQYKKCRNPINKELTNNWTVYDQEVFLCGEMKNCPVVNGVQYQCLNPIDYGVKPNPEQLQNMAQGYGLITFSNIGSSFFTTFKQVFITGSAKTIDLYKKAFPSSLVILNYIYFTYLISIIYFNIFYGLLLIEKIKKQNNEQESTQSDFSSRKSSNTSSYVFSAKSPSEKRTNTFIKFSDTLSKATSSMNNKGNTEQIKKKRNLTIFQEEESIESVNQSKFENMTEENKSGCLKFYKNLRVLFAFLCCLNLSLNFEGQSKQFQYVKNLIGHIFYLLFLVEFISLVIYQNCIRKKETGIYLKVQFFIGLMYTIGLIYDGVISSSFEEFILGDHNFLKICRCFLFLRIFTALASSPYWLDNSDRIILKVPHSIYMARHFLIIWMLIILILSLMGFCLHNRIQTLPSRNWYDRFHFEGIYPSMMFTLLTVFNEEWDTLMFKQYHYSGSRILFWQFFVMLLGFMMCSKYLMLLFAAYFDTLFGKNIQKSLEKREEKEKIQQGCKINQIKPNSSEENQDQEKDCEQIACRKLKDILKNILESHIYGNVKFFIIFAVVFTAFLTHPQADFSSVSCKLGKILSYCCTIFFLLELIAKLITEGFWNERSSLKLRLYFLLKIIILLVEICMFSPLSNSFLYFRIEKVRILRAIQLFIIRYEQDWQMKILLNSIYRLLIKSLRPTMFLLLIYFFFGLILNILYKNDYYYCDNAHESGIIITKEDCLNWGGDWVRHTLNFSNPWFGLQYTIIAATMGGWSSLMVEAMDMSGDGLSPSLNANIHIQIFFVLLFFIGNMILLNSYISLILNYFNKIKEDQTGQSILTEQERTWLKVKIQILKLKPIEKEIQPTNLFRKYAFNFANHKAFLISKSILFFFPILRLSIYTIGGKSQIQKQVLWAYLILIVIFESIILLMATGKKNIHFHVFFLGVALPIYFWLIFGTLTKTMQKYLEFIFLALVFTCIIRVIDSIKFSKKIFNSILTILPKTKNIFLLLSVFMVSFTILGMELFSFLKFGKQLDQFTQNYTNPAFAIYALVKFSFMQSSIQQIIDSSSTLAPNFICNQISNYQQFLKFGQTGCGSIFKANIFFFCFHLFHNVFLTSIFLAFIVDSYADVRREERSHVTKYLLNKAQLLWSEKDPEATGLIPYRDFWLLTKKLINLFEEENKQNQSDVLKEKQDFLKKLSLPVYEDESKRLCFEFSEFIEQLTKMYLERKMNCIFVNKNADPLVKQWVIKEQKTFLKKTPFKSSDVHTLILLKSGLKSWKQKSTLQKTRFIFKDIADTKKKTEQVPILED